MSSIELRLSVFLGSFLLIAGAGHGIDVHLDDTILTGGCQTCHKGHGAPRSPMLPAPQAEVCMSCHGSQADVSRQIQKGNLVPNARPQLMNEIFSQSYTHPITKTAYSWRDPDAVTCTSCHSPHRDLAERTNQAPSSGRSRLSSRDPTKLEFQLCQRCHGNEGVTANSLLDLSRLTNPNSRSYHPIEAPTSERSESVNQDLVGSQINCTDCHGNENPGQPRGPHGANIQFLLRRDYSTADGRSESLETYALCYACHNRGQILQSTSFPSHRLHIVELKASCASCHNAHGSVDNRALIRFGEETLLGVASPSLSTGLLAFDSDVAGSGSCFLTCHGVDHNPKSYGAGGMSPESLAVGSPFSVTGQPDTFALPQGRIRPIGPRAEPEKKPPPPR